MEKMKNGNFSFMNRLTFVLLTCFIISCQIKNSDKSNLNKRLDKDSIANFNAVDSIFDYKASFILENFISFSKPKENEITIINEDCGIFTVPDSIQISKMKGKTKEEEEGFYVGANDNDFYQSESKKFLDSLKIKTIYPTTRYLKFKTKGGSILFDTKSKYTNGWMVVLFLGDRKPKIVDFGSIEDSYNDYLKE